MKINNNKINFLNENNINLKDYAKQIPTSNSCKLFVSYVWVGVSDLDTYWPVVGYIDLFCESCYWDLDLVGCFAFILFETNNFGCDYLENFLGVMVIP